MEGEDVGEGQKAKGEGGVVSWAVAPASQKVCQRRMARLEWSIMNRDVAGTWSCRWVSSSRR